MSSTFREMCQAFGVTKPTVMKIAKELDPDEEHITVGENRTKIMDDFLSSAVANELAKKRSSTRELPEEETTAIRQVTAPNRVPRISGPRKIALHESDSLKEVYERLLEAEKQHHAELLSSKQDELDRLKDDLREAREKIHALEDKLEAERARYDALNEETFKTLTAHKQGFWRRLFGRPKNS